MKTHDDLSNAALRRHAKERFATAERMEAEYLRSLRMLTRHIDHVIKAMAPKGFVRNPTELQRVLRQYSQAIEPWARAVAEKLYWRVSRKDEAAWMQLGKQINRSLREELQNAPTGNMFQDFLNEQVKLITSLPVEAAERVHKLTTEAMLSGKRAEDIAQEILQTGKVTENRAKLIARTEVAKAASGLTMVRAQHVGVTHAIWRTSGDASVRESHRKMNGKIFRWDDLPIVDGQPTLPGGTFNCRCWAEPIMPEI